MKFQKQIRFWLKGNIKEVVLLLKSIKSDWTKSIEIAVFILMLIFYYGWLFTTATPVGNKGLKLNVYFYFQGLPLVSFILATRSYLFTPKYDKFKLNTSLSIIFITVLACTQPVVNLFRGGGIQSTDYLIGVYFGIAILMALYNFKKLIRKQQDVQKFIWINNIMQDGIDDKVRNPCFLMKHHILKYVQNGDKFDPNFILNQLEEQDKITERLVKMNEIANEDD